MTFNQIKNDLFIFFGTHETFSLDENFDELYVLCPNDEKPFTKALIEKALAEYEQGKFVHRIDFGKGAAKKTVWILDKPIQQYSQTLDLTYPTLSTLTQIINQYCDEIKNDAARVNPLNVQEKDIQSLCVIVHQAMGGE